MAKLNKQVQIIVSWLEPECMEEVVYIEIDPTIDAKKMVSSMNRAARGSDIRFRLDAEIAPEHHRQHPQTPGAILDHYLWCGGAYDQA